MILDKGLTFFKGRSDGSPLQDSQKKELSFISCIYYILFAFFYSFHFAKTTMFFKECFAEYSDMLYQIYDKATAVLLVLSIVTILFCSNKISSKVLMIAILVISYMYNFYRGVTVYKTITVFLLLIVCSQNKSLKTICRLFLIIGWGWVIASFIACKAGILTDITLGDRHSFGSIYCTDLACHLLTLVMAHCILRNGKLKIYEYGMIVLLMGFNVLYLKAKVGLICMFLILVVTAFNQYIAPHTEGKNKKNSMLKWICIASFSLLTVITVFLTLIYTKDSSFLLNRIPGFGTFTSRFYMGRVAFDQYDINLWGNNIPENGNGGKIGGTPVDYFFLDISYTRILLTTGAVIFALLLLIFTALQIRLHKHNRLYLMAIVAIFLLDCAVEHHMLELAYDFFPLMLFCNLNTFEQCSNICMEKKRSIRDFFAVKSTA
ncbi:MAG: hypothetical protein J6U23_07820 [Clostridiales bacterium]|nr:hypothetical protein [Clostridiales bacterium]